MSGDTVDTCHTCHNEGPRPHNKVGKLQQVFNIKQKLNSWSLDVYHHLDIYSTLQQRYAEQRGEMFRRGRVVYGIYLPSISGISTIYIYQYLFKLQNKSKV